MGNNLCMIFQHLLPINPADTKDINDEVGYVDKDGVRAYYVSGVAVFVHELEDRVSERIARLQLLFLAVVTKEELSKAFDVTTTTLYRQELRAEVEGIAGLLDKKRGPQGPHKLVEARIVRAQELADKGYSKRAISRELGVSPAAIRFAFNDGRLKNKRSNKRGKPLGPKERSDIDATSTNGVAVKRNTERAMAMEGSLQEAPPVFQAVEGVRGAGVLIALPVLLDLGLIEIAENVYGSLKKGFYGLRHLLLLLALMSLLRIKNAEQLSKNAPGELGILLGLDRVPEVKTLRRKLGEIADQKKAYQYGRQLAVRWTQSDPEALGILYIDGHVRSYHGQFKLAKNWVSRQHLCAPATNDIWVNDIYSQPLFFITATANEKLTDLILTRVIPEIRAVVGPGQRLTFCFDRGGWNQKFFKSLSEQNFDVLTYRARDYDPWPEQEFRLIEESIDGRRIKYELAEKEVEVQRGFWMREVRRRCPSGHQTAILTTRRDLSLGTLAYRMFNRWGQENFFKYMRENFAIDHLWQRGVENIDQTHQVANPLRKRAESHLKASQQELKKLQLEYGKWIHPHSLVLRKKRGLTRDQLANEISALGGKIQQLKVEIKKLPTKVPLAELPCEDRIVRLRYEMKHLVDTIKMLAYRAECQLFHFLDPLSGRNGDEGRAFLREVFSATADILPDTPNKRLRVCFHSLANPRSNILLARLCEIINQTNKLYPGTNLVMEFEAPPLANPTLIIGACQEV
jgi:hypothetical protein